MPRISAFVPSFASRAGAFAIAAIVAAAPLSLAGTWTRLVHDAPTGIVLMILASDGTVVAFTGGSDCYKLTPDIHGSYVNGTWSTRASMHDTRLWFSSGVLKDGRIFVAGGEYGTGNARAEVYDPVLNTWMQAPVPTSLLDPSQPSVIGGNQQFYDANSMVVANGDVLITPVLAKTRGNSMLYHPLTNTWSAGPTLANNTLYQDEASWVKLPDDSILTVDPFGVLTERYIPASNTWISDSNCPVQLYDPFGFEMGAAFVLPNGNAFFLGATGHTAIYTPSGTTAHGSWIAGPDVPGNHGAPDAGAAMMVTGRILYAVSPVPTSADHFPTPTTFYEYDWASNSFASMNAPNGATDNISCYEALMLDLPDGSVLYSHFGSDVYTYRPTGSPLAIGKPVISTITDNGDGSYHLTGTGLNGISEGASYGDDAQMSSNYPLVRLSDLSGNVYYATTFNWSSTGLRTGNQVLSTDFTIASTVPVGQYSLVSVANGIASDPVAFQVTTQPARPAPFGLLTPLPGSVNQSLQPTLDWGNAAGAVDYTVTVDDSADFSSPILSQTVAQSQFAIGAGSLQYGVTYFWKVTARGSNNLTTLARPGSGNFTTAFIPAAFNLLSPANGATAVALNVTLTWQASPLAADYLVTLDNNADFSSPIFSIPTNQTQLGLSPGTLQPSTTYYWKVVARSVDQVITPSSPAIATFTTLVPPPPCIADLTGDGQVNTVDLQYLLGAFGQAVPPGTPEDINHDGTVNTPDLVALLDEFGRTCPPAPPIEP